MVTFLIVLVSSVWRALRKPYDSVDGPRMQAHLLTCR